MARIRLLLVDDSEVFCRSARNFLADHADFEVCGVASSVSEALTLVGSEVPDVVIMDIDMPQHSGLDGARLLKALPAPPGIILISLTGPPETVNVALAAGADGFVAKSSIGVELVPMILALCADRGAGNEVYVMTRSAHILLVEDNRMDVELTLDAFRERRLTNTVHVANNGQLAMDYLLGSGDYANRKRYPLPDLILLDLKMPVMDGHEVLRRIKASTPLKRIPVVILSSSKEEGDLVMTYDNGANSYLVKPVSFDGFLEVVKRIDDYWLTLNVPALTDWQ